MTAETAAPVSARAPRLSDRLVALARLQASAAIFGISLLAMISATALLWPLIWPEGAPVARYDALLLGALAIQAVLLASRLETWAEARAILLFHLVGTAMELFKTEMGSWVYPEPGLFRIAGVPLFTGFMYSAVGSYVARSWRLFDARLDRAPPFWVAGALAAAAYANFFAHHFVWDARWLLFGLSIALFARTGVTVRFPVAKTTAVARVPILAVFLGLAVLIWVAENIATWGAVWLYPTQEAGWRPVSPAKIGSWFLLGMLSVVLAALAAPMGWRGGPIAAEAISRDPTATDPKAKKARGRIGPRAP